MVTSPSSGKYVPPHTAVTCRVSSDPSGFLGRNWSTLEQVLSCWQDVRCLRLYRYPGWRTRSHDLQHPLHLCPPRTDLRPSRVQAHLPSTIQPDRDPRWYVKHDISSRLFHQASNLISGSIPVLGSSWGAGTFAGTDGSRQPSPLEMEIASLQGKGFWEVVAKYHGFSK